MKELTNTQIYKVHGLRRDKKERREKEGRKDARGQCERAMNVILIQPVNYNLVLAEASNLLPRASHVQHTTWFEVDARSGKSLLCQ